MNPKVFESAACRVWTGSVGTPLRVIEDADQQEMDVIPFRLEIWIRSEPNYVSVDAQKSTQHGLYLVQSPPFGTNSTHVELDRSITLPADILSCFSLYIPSPFVSNVLVVVDVNDTMQQSYFFGRIRQVSFNLDTYGKTQFNDEDNDAYFDMEAVEELLGTLNAAFPKVHLSSSAKKCLADRKSSRRAVRKKVGEMVRRRKTLSAEAFYGIPGSTSLNPFRLADAKWRSFLEKLQFRVSHSLMCQLEGTAPISSSFPRQQEAFEFADQVAAFRRQKKASFGASSGYTMAETPRVFSFENANDGKRRFLVASFAEFWKNYKTTRDDQRHVYEIIREGVPCRLYFDLEFKRSINLHVDGNALVARLVSLLQLQLFRCYRLHVSSHDIYELDSSTSDKFSRHLILHFSDGSLFKDNLHAGGFVRDFIRDLVAETSMKREATDDLLSPFLVNTESAHDIADKRQLFIDLSVYTRNRMFRVLGSSKFKKQTVLRSLRPHAGTEFDQDLFEKTLVCPFPSLESMRSNSKMKYGRLLQCKSSLRPLIRSRIGTTPKTVANSSIEGQNSMYPELDEFIRSRATKGGVQGEIRSIQIITASNLTMSALASGKANTQEEAGNETLAMQPIMIIYHMKRNRWCANIERAHKSNNVMFIVDIQQRVFYQKCHDPACQAIDFRSPPQVLPRRINFNPNEKKIT